jgi:uncharacterized membrane protein YozB (DUF420 family)
MSSMLSIGLGHPFLFNTTFNLLLQIITLGLIFLSLYFKIKNNYKIHGTTMGIALILHVLTFLLIMGPIFFDNYSFFSTETSLSYVQTTWLHAIPGAIALVLGIYLVLRWTINASNIGGCIKRKRIMDLTLLLWAFSLVFGIATYVLIYF